VSFVLINGVNVSSANVNVNVYGELLEGVTKIEYSRKGEHVMNYALGQEAVSMGLGKYTYSGSITMYTETWFGLYQTLGFSPLQAPLTTMNITISPSISDPLNPPSIGVYTDELTNVKFLTDEFMVSSGDTKTEITVPFILNGITRFF
jgi:hypothetical protein